MHNEHMKLFRLEDIQMVASNDHRMYIQRFKLFGVKKKRSHSTEYFNTWLIAGARIKKNSDWQALGIPQKKHSTHT